MKLDEAPEHEYDDIAGPVYLEDASGAMRHSRNEGKRRRKTVDTDSEETVSLPEEPPPGWAEP